MLVWSINRVGDGPFNAYKNLGDDLGTNDPKAANDKFKRRYRRRHHRRLNQDSC